MINGDIARQWEAEHNKKQQRLRQDRKTGAKRRRVRESMNALSAKAQRRKSTLIHEAAARVVQFAKRRRLAKVEYDGTIKSFVRSFPWFELAEKIKYKCEDAGIAFVDVTQTVAEPDAQKPHIYFALGTITGRVKIGKTTRAFSDRKNDDKSFRSEPIVLLAVDNQPKTKLTKKEKHWHAVFAEHRVKDEDTGDEWFHGEPVIDWLREAEWIGNAGNLSQIAQFLDVSTDAVKSEPPPGSPRETIGHGA